MIVPLIFFSIQYFEKCLTGRMQPASRFSLRTNSMSSALTSWSVDLPRLPPAPLRRMSTWPVNFTDFSIPARMESSFIRSTWTALARLSSPRVLRIWATFSLSASWRTSQRITLAPAWASASAMRLQSTPPPPVTTAVRPSRLNMDSRYSVNGLHMEKLLPGTGFKTCNRNHTV